MTVAFRNATETDVLAVILLLADDILGAGREGAELEHYRVAFRQMEREGNNHLIVGERGGEIVATYQLTFISGLSLRAARRAQIESVRTLLQLTMNKTRTDTARFYQRLGFTPSHIGYKRDLT